MAAFDFTLPSISDEQLQTPQGTRQILEAMYQLSDQLRYIFANLDTENFTASFQQEVVATGGATKELKQKVEDTEKSIATVTTESNKIGATAQEAKSTAEHASATAADAKSTAQSATQTATEAKETATGAATTAGEVQSGLNSLQTQTEQGFAQTVFANAVIAAIVQTPETIPIPRARIENGEALQTISTGKAVLSAGAETAITFPAFTDPPCVFVSYATASTDAVSDTFSPVRVYGITTTEAKLIITGTTPSTAEVCWAAIGK